MTDEHWTEVERAFFAAGDALEAEGDSRAAEALALAPAPLGLWSRWTDALVALADRWAPWRAWVVSGAAMLVVSACAALRAASMRPR